MKRTCSYRSACRHATQSLIAFAALSTNLTGCGDDETAQAPPSAISEGDEVPSAPNRSPETEGNEDACKTISPEQVNQLAEMVTTYFEDRRKALNPLATTTTPLGMVLDWIDPKSQVANGQLPTVPPLDGMAEGFDPLKGILTELQMSPSAWGPAGTVPIARPNIAELLGNAWKCKSVSDVVSKYGSSTDTTQPPIEPRGWESSPNSSFAHHYGVTRQRVVSHGTSAVLSVPRGTYVMRADEFTLSQFAVTAKSGSSLETIEGGWQLYPTVYADPHFHLFIFFTTNGYTKFGNRQGGYNDTVDGFVQVSSRVYPRDILTPGSELALSVRLWNGNWWIGVNQEWMGYYPGWMFTNDGLGSAADAVAWYGEILDYRLDERTTLTCMGTGFYPGPGSAFARNMTVSINNFAHFYQPEYVAASKPTCYDVAMGPAGSAWGTHMLYGGPGAGSPNCH